MFVPPTGGGAPAPEAAEAWKEATSACRDARNASATLRVALRQGHLRSPSLAVLAVATSAGEIRLEDSTVFVIAGTAARATLLLRQEKRYVTARADDIVNAFIGVRIGPERLLAVLTGCVTTAPATARLDGAMRYGKQIAVTSSDARVFIERRDGRWRAVAGDAGGVIVEYRGAFANYWPSAWRASSPVAGATPIVLDAGIEDLEVNAARIDPLVFQVKIPDGWTQITLDQLRASGPLRGR